MIWEWISKRTENGDPGLIGKVFGNRSRSPPGLITYGKEILGGSDLLKKFSRPEPGARRDLLLMEKKIWGAGTYWKSFRAPSPEPAGTYYYWKRNSGAQNLLRKVFEDHQKRRSGLIIKTFIVKHPVGDDVPQKLINLFNLFWVPESIEDILAHTLRQKSTKYI